MQTVGFNLWLPLSTVFETFLPSTVASCGFLSVWGDSQRYHSSCGEGLHLAPKPPTDFRPLLSAKPSATKLTFQNSEAPSPHQKKKVTGEKRAHLAIVCFCCLAWRKTFKVVEDCLVTAGEHQGVRLIFRYDRHL